MAAKSPLFSHSRLTKRSRCAAFASVALATIAIGEGRADAQETTLTASGAGDVEKDGTSVRTSVGAAFEMARYRNTPPPSEDDSDDCCFTMFRGVDPNDVDGFEVTLSSELARFESAAGGDTEVFLAQSAAASAYGWRLEQRLEYQEPTSFADPFWRSSRNLASIGGAISIPPMWSVGTSKFRLWTGALHFDYAELIERQANSLATAEFDLDLAFRGVGMQFKYTEIGIFHFRLREFGVPLSQNGNVTKGQSVSAADFEISNVSINVRDVFALSAAAGIGFRSAVSPFTTVTTDGGVSTRSEGEPMTHPVLWLSMALPATESRPLGIAVGGGAFARVSPDSFGMDRGVRGEATASTTVGDNIDLTFSADIASVKRAAVSELAPDDIAPAGTRFLLARGTAGVSVPIGERLALTANAYAERSDRDDPRQHRTLANPEDWRYGFELMASYALSGD